MPGVADSGRVVLTTDTINQTSVLIMLPDNSQVLVTADRAVYIRDGRMITLSQWQFAPADDVITDDPVSVPEIGADVPRVRPRRHPRQWPGQEPYMRFTDEDEDQGEQTAPYHFGRSSMSPSPP